MGFCNLAVIKKTKQVGVIFVCILMASITYWVINKLTNKSANNLNFITLY